MSIEDIKEKENRYRIICLKRDEDYIFKHLHELKGRFIYSYEKDMWINIIYDTECSNNEINSFIKKHMNYLAVFEIYEKMYD